MAFQAAIFRDASRRAAFVRRSLRPSIATHPTLESVTFNARGEVVSSTIPGVPGDRLGGGTILRPIIVTAIEVAATSAAHVWVIAGPLRVRDVLVPGRMPLHPPRFVEAGTHVTIVGKDCSVSLIGFEIPEAFVSIARAVLDDMKGTAP